MESNIAQLRKNHVSLVRRRSGGGAVYHMSTMYMYIIYHIIVGKIGEVFNLTIFLTPIIVDICMCMTHSSQIARLKIFQYHIWGTFRQI